MNLMDSLERKLGHLAIPNVTAYIVAVQSFFFLLYSAKPTILFELMLIPDRVMAGEFWRLVTFIFIPPGTGMFTILSLLCLWSFGNALESAWGTFRYNLFILTGGITTILTAFFILGTHLSNGYLFLTIFLAYATLFPEAVMYLFFIIPVKARWLGWFTVAVMGFNFVFGEWSTRAAILSSVFNYLLFFWPLFRRLNEERKLHESSRQRRKRFEESVKTTDPHFHKCRHCLRTDQTNPTLEFRISSVDGEEYCIEHIAEAGKTSNS